MKKKCRFLSLIVLSCLFAGNLAWGTLPASKINGKYYLSQSPWSGSITTAINDVNALDAQVTLVIDSDTTLSYDRTVDKEVTLEFVSGAKITIIDTCTLTVNGPMVAGAYQIFIDNTADGDGVQGDAQIENVLPEWWGAARNVVTDSSGAINKAVKFAQTAASTRKAILFSDGSYYINSPIILVAGKPVTIKGTSYYNSRIIANATIDSIFDMSSTSTYERYTFIDIAMNGNYKADYCIYTGSGSISGLRCTRVLAFCALKAGVSIGTGICNSFIDCEILNNGNGSNLAHGLELRNGGYHNGINITASKIVNNTGFGVFAVNTCSFNISKCVIEGNDTCGIGVCLGNAINIKNNYFEANGTTGFTATVGENQATIQSQIFFNGTTSYSTLLCAYEVNGITVSGNYYTNNGNNTPEYFIYGANIYGGEIENNCQSSDDTSQELFVKRDWPTHMYRNVSLNGQKFYYAPGVSSGGSEKIEFLSYISANYPATIKVVATGKNGTAYMSFEINVLIKSDQTIGGYTYGNQINTTLSTAPTIINGSLSLNNLPAGDWTFVYKVNSIKIE
jgi:Right handed beta helix region